MAEIECKSLEECPWQQLDINEHALIVKCFKKKSTCEVLVSDYAFTWYERLDAFGVIDRNARFNPSIETSVDRLLLHVVSIFDRTQPNETDAKEKASAKFSVVNMSDSQLNIESESRLCGEPFSWEFNLARREDDALSQQLMKPLISMTIELSRRQEQLFRILADKDAQIADYKAEGFKIPRRHNHEEPFDEKHFQNEMTQSEEFRNVVSTTGSASLNYKLQSLYSAVMSVRSRREDQNDLKSKNNLIDEHSKEASKGVADTETVTNSNKELELLRRQALESRLAEERTKKEIQSKNKKLKL